MDVFSLQLSVNASPGPVTGDDKNRWLSAKALQLCIHGFLIEASDEMPNSSKYYPFIKISCGVPKRSGVVPFTQRI